MRTAIWGAGQAGIMIKNMLPRDQRLICFIDTDKNKQNTFISEIQVLSPQDALELCPDKIWIAVLNKDALKEIKEQILSLRFDGEIVDIGFFKRNQDLRLASIRLISNQIKERGVKGAIAELGVYKGETAAELSALFPDRRLYLFDTFSGFDNRDLSAEPERSEWERPSKTIRDFSDTSEKAVMEILANPQNAIICKGYFPESLSKIKLPEKFAFVSLDPDLYLPVLNGLNTFYPLMSKGGIIHIHDYNSMQYKGVKAAVDEFCVKNGLFVLPIVDFHGSAVLMKT